MKLYQNSCSVRGCEEGLYTSKQYGVMDAKCGKHERIAYVEEEMERCWERQHEQLVYVPINRVFRD